MKFIVSGQAFVPVKVKIEIEAKSAAEAMNIANVKMIRHMRPHIVVGSEDYAAAFRFDASDAEPIPTTRELTKD